MPTVPIILNDVQGWKELEEGTYYAEIESAKYIFQTGNAKGDSLRIGCVVLDEGKHLGEKATIFVHLSEKSVGRSKREFFAKFGEEVEHRTEPFEVDDDDPANLVDPDFVGARVIIESYPDKPKPGETQPQMRIRLVSVEEWDEEPAPTTVRRATKVNESEEADIDDGSDEDEGPAPEARNPVAVAAKAKRRTLR